MKSVIQLVAIAILLSACASSKKNTGGHSRTTAVQYVGNDAYLLSVQSDDNTYGYQQHNPVKVGGLMNGPANERKFLNGLSGPNGERVSYYRAGSCCPFRTPKGLMGKTGMLDKYLVTWTGATDTLAIYINMYDEGDLKIPVGFSARKN
jgi:hypothetical protein